VDPRRQHLAADRHGRPSDDLLGAARLSALVRSLGAAGHLLDGEGDDDLAVDERYVVEDDRGRWPARRREPEPQIVVGARARFRLLRFGALAGKRALAEETALAGIDILAAVGLAQEESVNAAVRDEAGMRFESPPSATQGCSR
jgi:hypothetical protein